MRIDARAVSFALTERDRIWAKLSFHGRPHPKNVATGPRPRATLSPPRSSSFALW